MATYSPGTPHTKKFSIKTSFELWVQAEMEISSQGLKLRRVKNKIYFSSNKVDKMCDGGLPKVANGLKAGNAGQKDPTHWPTKSPQHGLLSPAYPSTNVIKPLVLWSLLIVAVICTRCLGGKEIFLSHCWYFTAYHPKSSRLLQIYKLMASDLANEDYVGNFWVDVRSTMHSSLPLQ